ncbi:tRNA 2-thiouridine(34) synthase MnmA [Paucibacter sp. B2R-40]|uniref:tRNA 2-thiouridine(34) synthase MnmA n=1 Tax=Paucibacter sp. B2R-40 TaxID=2893554 RepID=UPI0021E47EA7|nr:tRNA 2-thiouridine(34) synthase MnmA [Paucibacter sp. B2R-40]MCV2353670.1 tRNA 2-thiouridine(34) synthase MnmA [Paucibacter sp. B2R-40]
MSNKKQRIVVGLSGGVDSAVTAYLLKQQGHEVIGIFMKNWEDDDSDDENGKYCSSNIDFVDAAAVADVIGIEIEHVNFAADYKDRVFATFLREYQAGRTPNPDILCNAEIKFKAFLDHAMRLGAEKIATGHYARVRELGGQVQLLKGVDNSKDQSYFLHRLNQAQLAKTLFPVGELHKTEVRRIAEEIKLPNARKKDSTGICFIGERPFREFLNRYLAHQPGPIKDANGRTIGEHVGLSFYTLGQRQGLGIGGLKPERVKRTRGAPAAPVPVRGSGDHAPWFVAKKDMASNTLYAVQGHQHPWLLSHSLLADDISWTSLTPPSAAPMAAKTRYRQNDADCKFSPDEPIAGQFRLDFAQAQWAVTPGQSAVLYDGEVCLGGGVIAQVPTPT